MRRETVTDAVSGLLWSAWTELGVRGVERRHERVAVDPEPLIVFTPALAGRRPAPHRTGKRLVRATRCHHQKDEAVGVGRQSASRGFLLVHELRREAKG